MNRFILAALLTAAACHVQTDNPPNPPVTDRGRVLSAVIDINWQPDIQQVAKACGRTDPAAHIITYACAQPQIAPDGLTAACTIFAVQPADFDDTPRLVSIGHELWHCFGARHG